jgi:hypothetical protein
MSEHHEGYCMHIPNGHVSVGGTTRKIVVRDKTYQFEMHRYFGPIAINRDESVRLSAWPGFVWDAVQQWIDEGKHMDGDFCVTNAAERVIAALKEEE